MSRPQGDLVRWGRHRARAARWRGDPDTAYLVPEPSAPTATPEFARRCVRTLHERGYARVVTAALAPSEQAGFLEAGFEVLEELHLLGIDLRSDVLRSSLEAAPAEVRLARARRRDRAGVLAVDHAAFRPFWRFDDAGLDDALAATPSVRWRVARPAGGGRRSAPVGYAITGRSGTSGFVQRLAVDPRQQRSGIGRALLVDGLVWLAAEGVRLAVVNTQSDNHAALALYLDAGFRPRPVGLSVLTAGLR